MNNLNEMFQDNDGKQNLNDLLTLVLDLRDSKHTMEQSLKVEKAALQAAETALINELTAQQMTAFKNDDGVSAIKAVKTHYSCPAGDRPNLHEWLRKNDAGDLIKEAVNFQTLGAYCRETEGQGNELPDFITKYEEDRITIRGR